MGINYYYHTNICEHCQRSDVYHVGEKEDDGSFALQTYPGINVASLDDWARVFKTTAGILTDENDVVIADPLQFLAGLKIPKETPGGQAIE